MMIEREDGVQVSEPAKPVSALGFELTGDVVSLFAALAKAQGEFEPILKTSMVKVRATKPGGASYDHAFAPLEEVINKTRKALSANGLAVVQPLVHDSEGWAIRTMLVHASGGCMATTVPLPNPDLMQDLGTSQTYIRRYSLTGILGASSEEDNDGAREGTESVQDRGQRQGTRATPPTPQQAGHSKVAPLASVKPKDDTAKVVAAMNSGRPLEPGEYVISKPIEVSSFVQVDPKQETAREQVQQQLQTAVAKPATIPPSAVSPTEPAPPPVHEEGKIDPKSPTLSKMRELVWAKFKPLGANEGRARANELILQVTGKLPSEITESGAKLVIAAVEAGQ